MFNGFFAHCGFFETGKIQACLQVVCSYFKNYHVIFLFFCFFKNLYFFQKEFFIGVRIRRSGVYISSSSLKRCEKFLIQIVLGSRKIVWRLLQQCLREFFFVFLFTFLFVCFWHNRKKMKGNQKIWGKIECGQGQLFCYSIGLLLCNERLVGLNTLMHSQNRHTRKTG